MAIVDYIRNGTPFPEENSWLNKWHFGNGDMPPAEPPLYGSKALPVYMELQQSITKPHIVVFIYGDGSFIFPQDGVFYNVVQEHEDQEFEVADVKKFPMTEIFDKILPWNNLTGRETILKVGIASLARQLP